jgi:hypothetical protein
MAEETLSRLSGVASLRDIGTFFLLSSVNLKTFVENGSLVVIALHGISFLKTTVSCRPEQCGMLAVVSLCKLMISHERAKRESYADP